MTDADRLEAVREIWELIKGGKRALDALYEYERQALARHPKTEPAPAP